MGSWAGAAVFERRMSGAGAALATTVATSLCGVVCAVSTVAVFVVVPTLTVRKYTQVQLAPGASVLEMASHWPLGMPRLSLTVTPVRVALPVFVTLSWYQTVSPSAALRLPTHGPLEPPDAP